MTQTQNLMDLMFNEARTYSVWQDKKVDESLLKQAYDIAKMAPTSANCSPMRVVFVKSDNMKQKLKESLWEGNVQKTMSAPVTAIVASDQEFFEKLPKLFPHTDAKSWYVGNTDLINSTAFRNSTLQGGYLILALRSLGLDCGPMSGFDNAKLDKLFFANTNYKSNFLINIGYGVKNSLHNRSPRLEFDEACELV